MQLGMVPLLDGTICIVAMVLVAGMRKCLEENVINAGWSRDYV